MVDFIKIENTEIKDFLSDTVFSGDMILEFINKIINYQLDCDIADVRVDEIIHTLCTYFPYLMQEAVYKEPNKEERDKIRNYCFGLVLPMNEAYRKYKSIVNGLREDLYGM